MVEPSLRLLKGGSNQLAALDLGSNSFHLMVAQEIEGRIREKYGLQAPIPKPEEE